MTHDEAWETIETELEQVILQLETDENYNDQQIDAFVAGLEYMVGMFAAKPELISGLRPDIQ
jgi:hypothetical protein